MGHKEDIKKMAENKDFIESIWKKNIKAAQGIAFKELGDRSRGFDVVDHFLQKKQK